MLSVKMVILVTHEGHSPLVRSSVVLQVINQQTGRQARNLIGRSGRLDSLMRASILHWWGQCMQSREREGVRHSHTFSKRNLRHDTEETKEPSRVAEPGETSGRHERRAHRRTAQRSKARQGRPYQLKRFECNFWPGAEWRS